MSKQDKHTPGPWDFHCDAVPEWAVQTTVYGQTGDRVAVVFDREANVPLIAAAPDLLAALDGILWSMEFEQRVNGKLDPNRTTFDFPRGIEIARAAIAKARGEIVR